MSNINKIEQHRTLCEELNAIYARMIEALTVNMPKGAAPQA